MGLKSLFKSNRDLGASADDAINKVIKELSGVGLERSKKVIDNVIAITGAAGGVGASTIVSNLAVAIAKKGLDVLVVDANILYPVQHNSFKIKQQIQQPDLVGYLLGKCTLGESLHYSGRVAVQFANNSNLMDSINCESDGAIDNFLVGLDKARQLFDLIIIDTPMRVDHSLVNTVLYIADKIYLIWDEGISSMINTEKIRRNMAFSGIDSYLKTKAILNKKTSVHYSYYPFEKLDVELIQVLPFDIGLIESGLKADIFYEKGVTSSKTGSMFVAGIKELSGKVLKYGGLV